MQCVKRGIAGECDGCKGGIDGKGECNGSSDHDVDDGNDEREDDDCCDIDKDNYIMIVVVLIMVVVIIVIHK